jgi:hypothetical protein
MYNIQLKEYPKTMVWYSVRSEHVSVVTDQLCMCVFVRACDWVSEIVIHRQLFYIPLQEIN